MARADSINQPRGGKRRSRDLTAVGYVRRSTDRQEQSIPDQKRAIERYAEEQGFRLLRFYVDDAISGTSTVGRKAFQTLIADAKRSACEFSQVIVYDVKRFGRVDNDEAGYYRHILKIHGVEILYVTENFTGDGTDDLLRPVKQWQAREESKDLSKVTIRGLVSKATNGSTSSDSVGGWWMGGAPPYGYDLRYESRNGEFLLILRYLRDGSKQVFGAKWKPVRVLERGESLAVSRRDRCKLVPGEQSRIETVKSIYRMYVTDRMGFKAIAEALNHKGIPSLRGPEWASHYSGRWSLTTVRAILVNPAYGGDMVWNRRTDARFHRIINGQAVERRGVVGRRLEPNDESDWIVVRTVRAGERTEHPTSKPVELFQIPMRQHTRPGDVCYEPFCGSGSQLIAAQQLGRRCYALEISPHYCDVIVRRWIHLVGPDRVPRDLADRYLPQPSEEFMP